ncbi:hypothetical protein L7F22_066953 [Adiantum nelumboides]|nr:hypothetical protein [Adiantum nelumboides]
MRAHELISSIQYDGRALLANKDGTKNQVLITTEVINEALHFYPGTYDLLAKTKSVDNEKAFLKAKGNKYKYADMIYSELELPLRLIYQHFRVQKPPSGRFTSFLNPAGNVCTKAVKTTTTAASSRSTRSSKKSSSDDEKTKTDKEQDSESSDKEEGCQKGVEAKGPSKHEPSEEEDTSSPLDRKGKNPRSVEHVLMDEAMARVEARKKALADARAAKEAAKNSTKETNVDVEDPLDHNEDESDDSDQEQDMDEFNAYMSKEAAKLDALGLNDVEKKKRLDKATKVEEERLKDRGYKYLSIANPLNGDEFFKLLYGIKWDDPGMLKITRDKLYCLRNSKITPERKKIILHLMSLTKSKDLQYAHFGDYKLFQGYRKKETYWAHLRGEATLLIERLQEKGPPLPNSFDEFYKLNLKIIFCRVAIIVLMYMSDYVYNCLCEGFKKESEEYIEETQKDALSPLSHGATQLTIKCSSQAIPLNKDKGHVEPPSTSKIPTPSSMPATTSSMAPSTLYMPATTPPMAPTPSSMPATTSSMAPSTLYMPATTPPMALAPSSMVATTSSLVHSTSFVTKSLLGHELWERRPITQSMGFQYQTIVDVLLKDISHIDKFALTSYMIDDCVCPMDIDGVIARGGVERSSLFFWWLLATFTKPHDYVLDVFAGCGYMGQAYVEDMRHCMCLELDDELFEKCLSKLACGPVKC